MKRLLMMMAMASLAATAAAQQEPMEARGFASDKVFDFHDVDSVNTFNGNLIVHIPIGVGFKFNGKVGYGMTLFYNSSSWHYEVVDVSQDPPAPVPEQQIHGNPVARANAGFGWYFSLGRLWAPNDPINEQHSNYWIYEGQDGADHNFYRSDDLQTWRTLDGSYLRMRIIDTSLIDIDFPDGTYQVFQRYDRPGANGVYDGPWTVAPSTSSSSLWRLTETRDYYGNVIHVDYNSTPTYKEIWTISATVDGARTPRVTAKALFKYPPPVSTSLTPNGWWVDNVLDEVDVETFGSSTLDAAYKFQTTVVPDMSPAEGDNTGNTLTMPILSSVDLPDGTSFGFTLATSVGDGYFSGSLRQLVLPTGGHIDYTWVERDPIPGTSGMKKPFNSAPIIVWQRPVTDPATSDVRTWRYNWAYSLDQCFCGNVTCQLGRQMTIFVTRPDQNTDLTYYSVYSPAGQTGTNCGQNGWNINEFGLPITHFASDPDNSSRLLSRDVRQGVIDFTSSPANGWDGRGAFPTTVNAATKTDYAQYEWDAGYTIPRFAPNSRVRSSSSRWGITGTGCTIPNSTRYTTSDNYAFDSYGHYRLNVSKGNIASCDGAAIETKSTFHGYTGTLPGNNWFLNTPTEECVSYGTPSIGLDTVTACSDLSAPFTTKFNWDSSTGFLTGKRALKSGTTDSDDDLLTLFTYDHGNIASAKFYGGDNSSGHGAGTGFTPPGLPQYQVTYSNQYDDPSTGNGGLKNVKATYSGFTFAAKDIDYDLSTGLVSASRDGSGLATTFDYDALGRVTTVKPPAVTPLGIPATTTYTYSKASTSPSFTAAAAVASTTTNSGGFVKKRFEYDGLGRLWHEKEYIDSSRVSTREMLYDALSRVWKRSELEVVPTHYTITSYDELSRPTTIQSADGKHQTTIGYTDGPRTVTRSNTVNEPAAITATTTETYDSFGRLSGVTDPVGTTGSYTYDAADRLVNVTVGQQPRTFTYDGRGFLTGETHPELDSTQFAYKYDSRGHILERNLMIPVNGVPTPKVDSIFNLRYAYDGAERLTTLSAWSSYSTASNPQYRPIKEMTYADANASGDFAMGKLKTALRHNYQPSLGDVRVTETYTYGDNAGHLTQRQTDIVRFDGATHNLQSLTQSAVYNDLGAIASTTYPTCNWSYCGERPWPSDQLFNAYTNGRLSWVYTDQNYPKSFASISRADNDTVTSIQHGNGVNDTITPDPNGLTRPQRITFQGWTDCPAVSFINPPADQTIASGTSTQLSFSAAGTIATIQWYNGANAVAGNEIAGQNSGTYQTPNLTATTMYSVRISNACSTAVASVTITVCNAAPVIDSYTPSQTITANTNTTLSVTAHGTGPLSYQWYQGSGTANLVGTQQTYTAAPATTTSYWARVTNACGSSDTPLITLTVGPPLSAPTNVVATVSGPAQIQITFNAVTGAGSYDLERHSAGIVEHFNITGSPAYDNSVVANRTYVYVVHAVANGQNPSPPSNADLATIVSFTTLTQSQTLIYASHFQEILDAINDIRYVNGSSPLSWANILPAGVPAPAHGVPIRIEHLTSLRTAMDSALTAVGVPTSSYSSAQSGTLIQKQQIEELRSRTQ